MTKRSLSKDPAKGHPHLNIEERLEVLLNFADPVGFFPTKLNCPKCKSTHLFQTVAKVVCLNCGFTWVWKAHINKEKRINVEEYL